MADIYAITLTDGSRVALKDATARSAIGSPLLAALATDMTDTTKIYVYTGSETGYTNGNWYYYDGSSWSSDGIYNSIAVATDTTLSVSGTAADAEATGNFILALSNTVRAGTEATANYHLGFYLDEDGDLCQIE